MTLRLVRIEPDIDVHALATDVAPGFGGDGAGALEALGQTVALLTADPRPNPWGSYLACDGGDGVGLCAFKTAPDSQGRVEIAYFTFPSYERRGYATGMAGALVRIARAGGASLVVANTLPQENASNAALRRNGCAFAGETIDPEDGLVWRWEQRLSERAGREERTV